MKKVLVIALALVMVLSLAACGGKKIKVYEGDAASIIASIYKTQSIEFMVGDATPIDLTDAWMVNNFLGLGGAEEEEEEIPAADENTPVVAEEAAVVADENAPAAADENVPAAMPEETTLAAVTDLGIAEAYFSEPMTNAQAYSLVIARVADADFDKVEAIKTAMFEGINTRKWYCVEADQLRVVSCGDIIMLVMASSELSVSVDKIVDAFAQVVSGAQVTDGDVRANLTGEILARG